MIENLDRLNGINFWVATAGFWPEIDDVTMENIFTEAGRPCSRNMADIQ